MKPTEQHTPHPWIGVKRPDGLVNIYVEGTKHDVALCVRPKDAPLIAAAPELLEALEFVQKWMTLRSERGDTFPAQLTDSIRAAIAKAADAKFSVKTSGLCRVVEGVVCEGQVIPAGKDYGFEGGELVDGFGGKRIRVTVEELP